MHTAQNIRKHRTTAPKNRLLVSKSSMYQNDHVAEMLQKAITPKAAASPRDIPLIPAWVIKAPDDLGRYDSFRFDHPREITRVNY